MDILQYVDRISPLSPEASAEFRQAFTPKTFKKGDYLLRADQVSQHYYLIQEGLTKSFSQKDGKEFIMTFFKEGMLFTEISSFLTQRPSKYLLMALEDTSVLCIRKADIEALYRRHHTVETLFRKLFSFATLGMMKRISEMLEENATERYALFLQDNPGLLQRISLGDLACYLGITQVSLSRIRAGK